MFDKFKQDIVYCTYCPKLCHFACPVTNAEARETVTPTFKMNLMDLIRRGEIEYDEDAAAVFYRCAGCLACRAYCLHRIDVPAAIEHARELAVNRGIEPPALERYIDTFNEHRNPFGVAFPNKLGAIDLGGRANKKAATLYFIGCMTLFHYPETANAIIKMLDAAGIDFAVHAQPESLCCGTPAIFSGALNDFKRNARALADVFSNYKTVVTGCPGCCSTMKNKYPMHGIKTNVKFMHMSELAAELIREGKLKPSGKYDARIMYHDPCHLAKHLGVYEEPREILRALFPRENIIEFSWNRDKNYCCGGGGLLPITAPKTSRAITHRRLREFEEHKPDMLVSCCPTCERTLHRAAPDITIKDVFTLLADKL